LPLVPLGRALVRKCFANKDWWGIPVMVIGAGKTGKELIKSLIKNPNLGYKPAVAIDNDVDNWGYAHNVPIIGDFTVIPEITQNLNIQHAIFAMPEENSKKQNEFIKKYSKYFAYTYFIPDYFISSQLWVSSFNLGGILGMEVRQRLLNPMAKFKKRIFDLVCTTILSIVVLPVFLLISLLILIDSRGKIFFYQERVGVNGSRFKVIKFRTMYKDAEARLQNLIAHDKKIKEEYELYHKLKNDPRVTKIGKVLRKFSLDELPQLWNIYRGDMSLIGPRAMMPWEQYQMNGHRTLILQVKPGLTGLWQVTDRNDTTFEERMPINIYYIRNWSIFLDIHILARTVSVVLLGKGGN
jgi:Undecaprenyl-phosphate galactose phosphotransferase WbaP